MHPDKTIYKVIKAPTDYKRCHRLMENNAEFRGCTLAFPTVVAIRDKKIIGFLSTRPSKDAVIAGPLVVSNELKNKAIVAMRLVEAYEITLKRAGVSIFLFSIPKKSNWARQVKTFYAQPFSEKDNKLWFRKELRA